MKSAIENSLARDALRITSKIDPGLRAKQILFVTLTVKKCLDCNRIITGKYVNNHKCSYTECNNCNKYVGKNHKCFMKKVKAKGGYPGGGG